MHDIDRTVDQFEPEVDELEFEDDDYEELEFDTEPEVFGDEIDTPLDETEEMELAAELLEVTDDAELDQLLGGLWNKVKKAARKVGRRAVRHLASPAGRRVLKRVRDRLRGVARRYLPQAGMALGGLVGGPAGAAAATQIASRWGRRLGRELDGLSPEDQQFEVARQYVRFAADAMKNAALACPREDPETAAQAALVSAARRHAPGLLRGGDSSSMISSRPGQSGRWIRRRGTIILYGV